MKVPKKALTIHVGWVSLLRLFENHNPFDLLLDYLGNFLSRQAPPTPTRETVSQTPKEPKRGRYEGSPMKATREQNPKPIGHPRDNLPRRVKSRYTLQIQLQDDLRPFHSPKVRRGSCQRHRFWTLVRFWRRCGWRFRRRVRWRFGW